MCGFAGFIAERGCSAPLEVVVRRMADAIAHRGPDDEGVWVDNDAGVALGHRRLAIVDLSPAGHQPMRSACQRFVIAFNGEIYNHQELRRALEAEGKAPSWRGHSDTEVLLAAVSAWGIDRALAASVGMFAFALWDRTERSLTLARDRLGEKPLYYGWAGDTFLFGSELRALARHPEWRGELDRGALARFMRLNNVPAPYSIFHGINKLEPGSCLCLRHGERTGARHIYWDAAEIARRGQESLFSGRPEEAVDHIEALVRQSLEGQMMADVPLGAFLSGGIDSSTVVALMQKLSPRPIRTFSIGFRETGYDEAPHAKAVAAHLGTDHTELYVTEREALAVVPRLHRIYSEPFADSSQIPTYLVSDLARRHVKVTLSGDGGDELFSGYRRYTLAGQLGSVVRRVPGTLRRAAASLMTRLTPAQWDMIARLPLALLPPSRRPALVGDKLHKGARVIGLESADDVYRALVSHWHEPEDIVIGASEPAAELVPAFASPVRRMMFQDLVCYLPGDILAKVDRASMAVGLEARVPFLDHRLVEFSWSLPLDILRRGGVAKWPLKRLLHRHVPRQLVERPKMGFGVPIGSWLRGPLRDWAEDLLNEARLRHDGILNPKLVREAWNDHLAGHRNLQYQLWNVLMFQAWHGALESSGVQPGPAQTCASVLDRTLDSRAKVGKRS